MSAASSLDLNSACVLWGGRIDSEGYGREGRSTPVHRIAYESAFGRIPAGMVVRHLCHNRRCVNPAHLAIGTHADNRRDTVDARRHAIGSRNGRAKLTEAQVADIRRRLAAGVGPVSLAREFGVTNRVIRFIDIGKTWRHVTQSGVAQ